MNNNSLRKNISRGQSLGGDDILRIIASSSVSKDEYIPVHHFRDFKIDPRLKKNITQKYDEPTPIQDKAIPLALSGRDILAIAETGTGKTAAFLIPAINNNIFDRKAKAIIIVPTREMAMQTQKMAQSLSRGFNMESWLCVGGSNKPNKALAYRFFIGTPARIREFITKNGTEVQSVKTIVIDEADMMLGKGFYDNIRNILKGIGPERKQIMLFSATMPSKVAMLAKEFLNNPAVISLSGGKIPASIKQLVVKTGEDDQKKFKAICNIFQGKSFPLTIVFTKSKVRADRLASGLYRSGIPAQSIHSGKNLSARKKAIGEFRKGSVVLVATDMLARGFNAGNVSRVINYDLPKSYSDYLHRIGRTGRGRRQGEAVTFI